MVERNRSNAVMQGMVVPPGSKSTSRAKGSRRNLGYLVSGRQLVSRRSASGSEDPCGGREVTRVPTATEGQPNAS